MKSIIPALKTGVPQLGLCVMYPSPGALERIAHDWDWAWLDGQHGQLGYSEMLSLVRACDLVNVPSLVRVPGHEAGSISLALDMGAAGVIVPCVDTPEQAHAAVKAAKFPPVGNRSYGGRRPIDFDTRTYSDTANQDTLLVLQIESPEAVENAAEIAAIPGVDALFLGPDDILLRRGYPTDAKRNAETLGADMTAVATACRQHNKYAVMVGIGQEMLELCIETGFNLIVAGGDVAFLANGSKQAVEQARAIIEKQSAKTSESRGSGPTSLY